MSRWHTLLNTQYRSSTWFFPPLSAYAALVLPLGLYRLLHAGGMPGLQAPTGHAYEMFFGLGLGLVVAVTVASLTQPWTLHRDSTDTGLLLFSLLMAYMGGRAIAPAAAGAHQTLGHELVARVQPGMEGALMTPFVPPVLPGGLSLLAGTLILTRLLRWRLWALWRQASLTCLAIGYGWLGTGLLVLGFHQLTQQAPAAALHLVTIGALGTLSTNMMARVVLKSFLKTRWMSAGLWLITLCIALSASSRYGADLVQLDQRNLWLWISAATWSAAYGSLAVMMLMGYKKNIAAPHCTRVMGVKTSPQQH